MNFILGQCFIAVFFWGALLEALFHPFSQISFICCSFFSPTFGLSLYIYTSLNPVPNAQVCVYLMVHIQNYNYKLHFQNLSIYHIPHVSMGTLAAENLDVCTTCDP
jgi:hypothetical protein